MTNRSGYLLTKRQASQYDRLANEYGDLNVEVTGFMGNEAEIVIHVVDTNFKNIIDRQLYVDGYGRITAEYK